MNLEQLEAEFLEAKNAFVASGEFNGVFLHLYVNMARPDLNKILKLEPNPLKAVAYFLASHKLPEKTEAIYKAAALQIQAEREVTKP